MVVASPVTTRAMLTVSEFIHVVTFIPILEPSFYLLLLNSAQ